jgi:hypothetical protein
MSLSVAPLAVRRETFFEIPRDCKRTRRQNLLALTTSLIVSRWLVGFFVPSCSLGLPFTIAQIACRLKSIGTTTVYPKIRHLKHLLALGAFLSANRSWFHRLTIVLPPLSADLSNTGAAVEVKTIVQPHILTELGRLLRLLTTRAELGFL